MRLFRKIRGHPKVRSLSPSTREPYREQVELALRLGRNAMAIWQDLVSDHGFAGGYEAVKRLFGSFADRSVRNRRASS